MNTRSVVMVVLLFTMFLWPTRVSAIRLFSVVEGPTGSTVCTDKIDNDLDGILDESETGCVIRVADFSTVTNGQAAETEAGIRTMSTITVSEGGASGGTAVSLCTGKLSGVGQVALCGSFSSGNYYVFLRGKAPSASSTMLWIHTSPLPRAPARAYSTYNQFPTGSYQWIGPIGRDYDVLTGTHTIPQATYSLSGSACLYISFGDSNVRLDRIFVSTSSNATPP